MLMYNNYIYIAVMALVSYTIRILPLTLIRKPDPREPHPEDKRNDKSRKGVKTFIFGKN